MVKHEAGLEIKTVPLEELEGALQGPRRGEGGLVHGADGEKAQEPPAAGTELRCVDFGCVSSWSSTAKSPYGDRATIEYLKEHPEEEEKTHVIM